MKTCFKCERILPLEKFHRHPRMADGHLGKCKACACRDARESRRARPEHYKAYDKARDMLSHRVEKRRRYYWENPEKSKARNAAGNAMRDGKLIRQPCEVCGNPKSHGHHPDYSRPLDVRWLCSCHHADVHQGRLVL